MTGIHSYRHWAAGEGLIATIYFMLFFGIIKYMIFFIIISYTYCDLCSGFVILFLKFEFESNR